MWRRVETEKRIASCEARERNTMWSCLCLLASRRCVGANIVIICLHIFTGVSNCQHTHTHTQGEFRERKRERSAFPRCTRRFSFTRGNISSDKHTYPSSTRRAHGHGQRQGGKVFRTYKCECVCVYVFVWVFHTATEKS